MLNQDPTRMACEEISRRLTESFSSKNADEIALLYEDKVIIWHNHTNTFETKVENISSLIGFFQLFSEVSYSDIRFTWTEEGFIQRHVITGKLAANGVVVEIPACLVIAVQDGKIVRLDEYGDPAPLLAALGAGSS